MVRIAVDGFAGSGKSTLVKLLAKRLGADFKVLDTGAIFRGFAYGFSKGGYGEVNEENVKRFLKDVSLTVGFVGEDQHIYIGKEDVTKFLRTEEISLLSAQISVFPAIRDKYIVIAQSFSEKSNCIMEGRDIGTVVMPNADVKIFLTADEKVRAKRRYDEMKLKDKKITLKKVLADLKERDFKDQNKGIYSLHPTEESVIVDNTEMTLEETCEYCLGIIKEKIGETKYVNIAIDGYVCSGKSTLAKALAKELGYDVFDVGAIYRGVACAFDYMGLDEKKIDEKYIQKFAKQIKISVEFIDDVEHVFVNGIDHTAELRTEHISALSAKISPYTCIRDKVLKIERGFASNHNLVMEGRDIGSHVLPNADFKFFCNADENVRAKRRYEQQKAMGNDVSYAEVLREVRERDYADVHREHGALKMVEDSILVDTTNQSLQQSVAFCLNKIREKK
ncbi:MAG: (d)CMP kinase [Clostridia bacterium]|nr:(d)CMP kinase [Clostridia bacterium]